MRVFIFVLNIPLKLISPGRRHKSGKKLEVSVDLGNGCHDNSQICCPLEQLKKNLHKLCEGKGKLLVHFLNMYILYLPMIIQFVQCRLAAWTLSVYLIDSFFQVDKPRLLYIWGHFVQFQRKGTHNHHFSFGITARDKT